MIKLLSQDTRSKFRGLFSYTLKHYLISINANVSSSTAPLCRIETSYPVTRLFCTHIIAYCFQFFGTRSMCIFSFPSPYKTSVSNALKRDNRYTQFNKGTPGQTLPAPMLLFPFLLFQFKLPLLLCFPLFPAHSLAFSF